VNQFTYLELKTLKKLLFLLLRC